MTKQELISRIERQIRYAEESRDKHDVNLRKGILVEFNNTFKTAHEFQVSVLESVLEAARELND